jgi:hypothetical protein
LIGLAAAAAAPFATSTATACSNGPLDLLTVPSVLLALGHAAHAAAKGVVDHREVAWGVSVLVEAALVARTPVQAVLLLLGRLCCCCTTTTFLFGGAATATTTATAAATASRSRSRGSCARTDEGVADIGRHSTAVGDEASEAPPPALVLVLLLLAVLGESRLATGVDVTSRATIHGSP